MLGGFDAKLDGSIVIGMSTKIKTASFVDLRVTCSRLRRSSLRVGESVGNYDIS